MLDGNGLLRLVLNMNMKPYFYSILSGLLIVQISLAGCQTTSSVIRHEKIRMVVAEIIAKKGSVGAIQRLAPMRTDPSIAIRKKIAELLSTIPADIAREFLDIFVHDVSAEVRATALATLLSYGDDKSLFLFIEAWKTAKPQDRQHLRQDSRKDRITSHLTLILKNNPEAYAREAAIFGISALAVRNYEDLVLPGLEDPEPEVRIATVYALAHNDDPEIRKHVMELLNASELVFREAGQKSHLRVVDQPDINYLYFLVAAPLFPR